MLILKIAQLDITLEFHFILFYFIFYFGHISACNLVFVLLRVTTVMVIMNACTDGVKLNYLCLTLNQK